MKKWLGLQTNSGGIISQQFQLSDQPNYGTWNIRVEAFVSLYFSIVSAGRWIDLCAVFHYRGKTAWLVYNKAKEENMHD